MNPSFDAPMETNEDAPCVREENGDIRSEASREVRRA